MINFIMQAVQRQTMLQKISYRIRQIPEFDTQIQEQYQLAEREQQFQTEYETEEDNQTQNKKPSHFKLHLLIIITIIVIHIYQAASTNWSQTVDQFRYIKVETAYPVNLINQPIKRSRWEKIRDQWQKINIYQPESSVYAEIDISNAEKINQQIPQFWRDNIIKDGTMVKELENWVVNNINSRQKYLIFWQERLALTITLMAKILNQMGGKMITVVITEQDPREPLLALKLTLKSYDLLTQVFFIEANQFTYSKTFVQYNLIIEPGQYFHDRIIQNYINEILMFEDMTKDQTENDPSSTLNQKKIAKQFSEEYANSRFILLYEHKINQLQRKQLFNLNNEIRIITSKNDMSYREVIVPKSMSKQFTNTFNIIIIYNIFSNQTILSPQSHKQAKNAQDKNQTQDKKSSNIGFDQKKQNSEANKFQIQKNKQNNKNPKTKNKSKLNKIKQIRRALQGEVMQLLQCTKQFNKKPPTSVKIEYLQTNFTKIKIVSSPVYNEQQLIDISSLAKFLMAYFLSLPTSQNIFYSMENQQIANIIALINNKYLFIPNQILASQDFISTSLSLNKLNSNVINLDISNKDISSLLNTNEISLIFLEWKEFSKWISDLQTRITDQVDIILRRRQNYNQIQQIKLLREKGFNIYIIFQRQSRIFDINCVKDFQFEIFDLNSKYPLNSFYFITASNWIIDHFDPINFRNSSIQRNMQILPYQCSSPPYYILQSTLSFNSHLLTDNKYHYPIYLTREEAQVYQRIGAFDQQLIEFINSCLVSNDKIFVHSEAVTNHLIYISLLKKTKYGSVHFTRMPQKNQAMLQKNINQNDVYGSFQILDFTSKNQDVVKQYYFSSKPNVIILTPQILTLYLNVLPYLKHDTLIIFKYNQSEIFNQILKKISEQHQLLTILNKPKERTPVNLCQDYNLHHLSSPQINNSLNSNWMIIHI